jgi:hypothetical protein
VHPFDCRDEVNLLRDFFSFSEDEMKLIVANDIGRDRELKEIFKL